MPRVVEAFSDLDPQEREKIRAACTCGGLVKRGREMRRVMEAKAWRQADLVRLLGVNPGIVSKAVLLGGLLPEVEELLDAGKISGTVAEFFARRREDRIQRALLEKLDVGLEGNKQLDALYASLSRIMRELQNEEKPRIAPTQKQSTADSAQVSTEPRPRVLAARNPNQPVFRPAPSQDRSVIEPTRTDDKLGGSRQDPTYPPRDISRSPGIPTGTKLAWSGWTNENKHSAGVAAPTITKSSEPTNSDGTITVRCLDQYTFVEVLRCVTPAQRDALAAKGLLR